MALNRYLLLFTSGRISGNKVLIAATGNNHFSQHSSSGSLWPSAVGDQQTFSCRYCFQSQLFKTFVLVSSSVLFLFLFFTFSFFTVGFIFYFRTDGTVFIGLFWFTPDWNGHQFRFYCAALQLYGLTEFLRRRVFFCFVLFFLTATLQTFPFHRHHRNHRFIRVGFFLNFVAIL